MRLWGVFRDIWLIAMRFHCVVVLEERGFLGLGGGGRRRKGSVLDRCHAGSEERMPIRFMKIDIIETTRTSVRTFTA